MKQLWDEDNLKAVGVKKDATVYKITINTPVELTTTNPDLFYSTRSILLRNNIEFNEFIINKN